MNVLFVSSEVAPFSKSGGLADISHALPRALSERGHHVWVVTPRYASAGVPPLPEASHRLTLRFPFGEVPTGFHLYPLTDRHRVLFVDMPRFFDRPGFYGDQNLAYEDNALRFGAFSLSALSAAQLLRFRADIIHLNDWQTGVLALAHKTGFAGSALGSAKTVFTIHNLAYQGLFPRSVLDELGIPQSYFDMEGLEFFGQVSFLKAGLRYADALTTVSPRYAREILTPMGGQGLDGFLRTRASLLRGILNGVDTREWNPRSDRHLAASFSAEDVSGKARCKEALLRAAGLPPSRLPFPLFAVVSRLTHQKGMEWVLELLPRLMEAQATLLLLGQGDPALEAAFQEAQRAFPQQLAVRIGFDEALSHQMEAGADFFLMPSRFEPCGLNQMYSMLYGTLPIVRAVGGLDDTVVDVPLPHSTGFKFTEASPDALWSAIQRALALYASPGQLQAVQRRAMSMDFSWEKSAREYEALYQGLLGGPTASGGAAGLPRDAG